MYYNLGSGRGVTKNFLPQILKFCAARESMKELNNSGYHTPVDPGGIIYRTGWSAMLATPM